VHILLIIQGNAPEFHPGVGFETAWLGSDPDAQVRADPLAAQQPPEGQGLGQALQAKKAMARRYLHHAGSEANVRPLPCRRGRGLRDRKARPPCQPGVQAPETRPEKAEGDERQYQESLDQQFFLRPAKLPELVPVSCRGSPPTHAPPAFR